MIDLIKILYVYSPKYQEETLIKVETMLVNNHYPLKLINKTEQIHKFHNKTNQQTNNRKKDTLLFVTHMNYLNK